MNNYDFLAAANSDAGESKTRKVFRDLFADGVDHVDDKTFLPGFVVRKILQMDQLKTGNESARMRLADWASAEMVDYLISPIERHRRALQTILNRLDLGLSVLTGLHRALHQCASEDSLVFRLIYFPSCDPQEVGRWLTLTLDDVAERCLAVENAIVEIVRDENPEFQLKHLHEIGIRPAGTTTRILDEVRLGRMRLWDAIANEAFLQRFPKGLRETSIINEVIISTANADIDVPENSERLAGYVGRIIHRLLAKRRAIDARYLPLLDRNSEGDRFAWDERKDQRPLLVNFEKEVERPRQQDMAAAMRRVLATFQQDHRDLMKTFELCYQQGLTVEQAAEELGVDRSTVGRREARIQEYFEAHLKAEGLDLGHYENRPRADRMENLYQLVEPLLRGKLKLPRRYGGYRAEMVKALEILEQSDVSTYEIIKESYLENGSKRSQLAQSKGIATKEYSLLQTNAKARLAKAMRDMVLRQGEAII